MLLLEGKTREYNRTVVKVELNTEHSRIVTKRGGGGFNEIQ